MNHEKERLHSRPLDGVWVKSSYSNGSSGDCVEVATLAAGVHGIRDSKRTRGPVLTVDASTWRAFLNGVHSEAID
ncbi:DUF397 domain-containing protein [Streptomyces sp. 3MP-14]|uniref:DUF397 domain-containing protein n=1 Tax=Streptomyces mimosae TaxID=2586635 RepID=A0A5N6AEM2_9ACTN|nr:MULTISPECIES: DUF397 domain-containing protein [Streptomyces]KAB8166299.1 DUF397 domain-containing protein [Streptomyces mimosae]KAB8174092.1 DUF397 domain-containing protein [Streptomyces sp. 3MP-14]